MIQYHELVQHHHQEILHDQTPVTQMLLTQRKKKERERRERDRPKSASVSSVRYIEVTAYFVHRDRPMLKRYFSK
jgi:glutamate 5-kinase